MSEHLPAADLIVTIGFPSREEAERAIETLPRKGAARHIWMEGEGVYRMPTPQKLAASAAALLGRLMVRSREEQELGILWSFITKEDFRKTNSAPEEIPSLMRSFAAIAALPHIAALFWQVNETEAEGMLWSEDDTFLDSVREVRPILERRDPNAIMLGRFANFIEAETETRKLLRMVL